MITTAQRARKKTPLGTWIWAALLAVQVVFLAVLAVGYAKGQTAPDGSDTMVALDIACILMAMLFYVSILRGNGEKLDARLFLLLLATNSLYLFLDAGWHFVQDVPSLRVVHIAVNVVYLMCPLAITLIYWHVLDIWVGRSERFYRGANFAIRLIAGIQVVLVLLTPFTGWFFVIPSDGSYIRGNLYILTIVMPFAMVLICIARVMYHRMPWEDRFVLLSYLFPPLIAAIVQGLFPGTTVLAAATFLFVALLFTNYYISREAEVARLEHDLVESDLKSLQMQINPHFLYNTLHSVAGLCDTDPQAAQEMTYRLADYMRDNFTDIEKPSLVTFEEELVQLDHYLDIESMRFPNITVEKDIQVSDFMIPVSTLQPLVENAIKHGIGKRKKGEGTVSIATRHTDDAWQVYVTDNGVGCNKEDAQQPRAGHYGLENVRKRLKILCNGELDVTSTPGQGTEVHISIPKNSGGGYSHNPPYA